MNDTKNKLIYNEWIELEQKTAWGGVYNKITPGICYMCPNTNCNGV